MGDKSTSCPHWEQGRYTTNDRTEKKKHTSKNNKNKIAPKGYFGIPEGRLKEKSKGRC